MIKVAFLVCDRTLFSGISRPWEILNAVSDRALRRRQTPPLSLSLVKLRGDTPSIAGDMPISVQDDVEDLEHIDWLFLPPIWRNPVRQLRRYAQLPGLLAEYRKRGTRIIATGSGAYFLAEAGLLDASPGTTHWFFFDDFEQRFPRVELKRQHFITYSEGIYCAGSINALSDLVFYLIGQQFGAETKQNLERHFVHEVGSSYDLPMFSVGSGAHADETIVTVQEWLKQVSAQDVDIAEMANEAALPVRTFTRRFKQALGVTPNQYLQDLRIENGRDMLKSTDLSVQDIADSVGYKDTAYFARVFKSKVGLTPTEYRKIVRAKLFQVSSSERS